MRTWQKALLIVVTIGLATWALVATRADPEPSYEGKPLHHWVGCFYGPRTLESRAREANATEALRHIGTNAFPILLQWLSYDNSIPRNHLWRRLPLSIRKIKLVGDLVFYSPKMSRAVGVTRALISLGPDASPAFPSLAELFITTTNFEVRTRCWVILREIGASAVPALTTAATDKRSYTNNSISGILLVLQQIRPPATSALPTLRILLQEPELWARAWEISNTITHITGQPVNPPQSGTPN